MPAIGTIQKNAIWVEFDDPHDSLPTQDILLLYDSMNLKERRHYCMGGETQAQGEFVKSLSLQVF